MTYGHQWSTANLSLTIPAEGLDHGLERGKGGWGKGVTYTYILVQTK